MNNLLEDVEIDDDNKPDPPVTRAGLTPVERLAVAYVYYTSDITMHQLALLYPGVNQGRIAEACKRIGQAAGIESKRKMKDDD